jgi:hypothetical protein
MNIPPKKWGAVTGDLWGNNSEMQPTQKYKNRFATECGPTVCQSQEPPLKKRSGALLEDMGEKDRSHRTDSG